jgi:Family of unknown function (DUF6958)
MRLQQRNPRAGRPYVRSEKYLAVRDAVLNLLATEGPGETMEALVARLVTRLPLDAFPSPASVRWFGTAVRIDLEARGLVQRVGGGRPARYLRRPLQGGVPTPVAGILIPDWGGRVGDDTPRWG